MWEISQPHSNRTALAMRLDCGWRKIDLNRTRTALEPLSNRTPTASGTVEPHALPPIRGSAVQPHGGSILFDFVREVGGRWGAFGRVPRQLTVV